VDFLSRASNSLPAFKFGPYPHFLWTTLWVNCEHEPQRGIFRTRVTNQLIFEQYLEPDFIQSLARISAGFAGIDLLPAALELR
jgi:hypothetical protein